MTQDTSETFPYSGLDLIDGSLALERAEGLILKRLLSRLGTGTLTVLTPSGARVQRRAPGPGPQATIVLHRWRALRRLLAGGGTGFSEAYLDGDWSSPDLTSFLELAARNMAGLDGTIGTSSWVRALLRLRHRLSANTPRGSRRNIAAHYDLGNAFYARWLDTGMTYSSALYRQPDLSLEDAQTAKQDQILRMLDLTGQERVLEIGCGWGGLAERMALAGAGSVTGITLSAEQLAHGRERIARAGLRDKVELRLQDYRAVEGQFDRIASIEMLEAVGEAYWPVYFDRLRSFLAPGGIGVIQVITIDATRFHRYRQGVDFIQRYIFPGGMLPTDGIVRNHLARTGLELTDTQSLGPDYALTLAEWRRRFHAAWPEIAPLGFDERFRRMWDYYLCYCEAGFRAGVLDVGLYRFTAPAGET